MDGMSASPPAMQGPLFISTPAITYDKTQRPRRPDDAVPVERMSCAKPGVIT
jgi:hypothetical protein